MDAIVRALRRAAVGLVGVAPIVCGEAAAAAATKPLSEKVTERVVGSAIEESLQALDRPENQARLGRILNAPPLREAMHNLTRDAVAGALDAASAKFQLDPTKTAPGIINATMSTALSERNAKRAGAFAQAVTHGIVAGLAEGLEQDMGPALAVILTRDVGPSVGTMMAHDLLPGVGEGLQSDSMQAGVAALMHQVASHLIHGADAAMDVERAQDKVDGKESGLSVFGRNVALGYAVAVFFVFALGTALTVLTVMLVRSHRRQRHLLEEATHREQLMMRLLDGAGTEGTQSEELKNFLRDRLGNDEEPRAQPG